MKNIKVTIEKVNILENILKKYTEIKELKLGISVARTLKNATETMDIVRKNLSGSQGLQAFRGARQKYLESLQNTPVVIADVNAHINELIEKHGVAEELVEIEKREREYVKEEVSLDIYPVSLEAEPGYNSKNADEKGLFTASDRLFLLDIGLLEWPEEEK